MRPKKTPNKIEFQADVARAKQEDGTLARVHQDNEQRAKNGYGAGKVFGPIGKNWLAAIREAADFCRAQKLKNIELLDFARGGVFSEKKVFSILEDTQLQSLLPLLNENFFVEALTSSELKEVFECKRTAKVKNLGAFSYLLNQLSKQGFLADNWQHQAEQGKMFVSVNGTPIKAKKLSTKLSEYTEQIRAYNKMYSKSDIPPTYAAKMNLKKEIDNLLGEL